MSDKQFTLYWLDGKRQVLSGETIEEAFTQAGYGAGAVSAVDFYIEGDNHEYEWNKEKRSWDRKEPLDIEVLIDHPVDKVNDYGYGINAGFVFTQMPEPAEDVHVISQHQADEITQSIKNNPGKYKLMVSYNLGATYRCEYSTDDKDDPELKRQIDLAKYHFYRYYVEGDDSIMAPAHKAMLEALGAGEITTGKKSSYQQGINEAHINMLRNKFGK